MAKQTLEQHVRDHYEKQTLSSATLRALKTLIRAGAAPVEKPVPRSWITAAAAIALIFVTAIWYAGHRVTEPRRPGEIARAVAQEAALGHNERQELEFRVTRCEQLRERMKSLDFSPVEPEMMRRMNMRIIGARYRAIEGEMAVQILYVDQKGVRCTLYEARPSARLARVPMGEHDVDGLRVTMWREKGLLMVLARPMA